MKPQVRFSFKGPIRKLTRALVAGPLFLVFSPIGGCAGREPGWIVTHAHPDYPDSSFLVGVGACDTAGAREAEWREAAYHRACAEIASQIRSRVESRWNEKTESTRRDASGSTRSDFTTRKSLRSVEFLEGVKIADTYLDPDSGVYYVLCVLDVQAFSRNLEIRLRETLTERKAIIARLLSARKRRAWQEVVSLFSALGRAKEKINRDTALLGVLDPPAAVRIASVRHDAPPDPRVDFSVELKLVSGGSQRALPGRPLSSPLLVRAQVRVFGETRRKGEPLPGFPLTIDADPAGALFSPEQALTDAEGCAAFSVTRVPLKSGPLTVTVSADLPAGARLFGLDPTLRVRIPIVGYHNLRLGLIAAMSERDRAGGAWVLERLTRAFTEVGPIRDRCFLILGDGMESLLDRFSTEDLVIVVWLNVDLFVPDPLPDVFSAEARLRVRLWSPLLKRWFPAGDEFKATAVGEDPLSAAESALLQAAGGAVYSVREAVSDLLRAGAGSKDTTPEELGAVRLNPL